MVQDGRGSDQSTIWRWGHVLVAARPLARLPPRCVVCNAPGVGARLVKTVRWHPPSLYSWLVVCSPMYVIVALTSSETARVELSLCAHHRLIRTLGFGIGIAGPAVGLGALAIGAAFASYWLILAGLPLLLIAPIVGIVLTRSISARSMDQAYVQLAVPRSFLESFPSPPTT